MLDITVLPHAAAALARGMRLMGWLCQQLLILLMVLLMLVPVSLWCSHACMHLPPKRVTVWVRNTLGEMLGDQISCPSAHPPSHQFFRIPSLSLCAITLATFCLRKYPH